MAEGRKPESKQSPALPRSSVRSTVRWRYDRVASNDGATLPAPPPHVAGRAFQRKRRLGDITEEVFLRHVLDALGIGAATHTVTAAVSPTNSQSLNSIPITPALAAAAVTGDAVTVVSPVAADYPVRGAIASYEASGVLGGVQTGDRRVIILAADLVAAGYTKPPKALDAVLFEGRTFTVMTATAVYQGAAPFAWDLQCK